MSGVEVTRAANGPPPVRADESGASVTDLVQLAIERNVAVDVIERLVALRERIEERDARAAFFDALATFQEQCPEIPKSRKVTITPKNGGAYSYSFAPLDAIARTIRQPLKANGLSYSWDVATSSASVLNITCVLRHIDGHEDRSTFPVPIDTGSRMSLAQRNGAALTYGKRQSLLAVLGLTTADQDIDGRGGDEVESETLTDAQLADLSAKIDEVGADKAGFLEYMGVDRLADIPQSDLKRGMDALERKRRAR